MSNVLPGILALLIVGSIIGLVWALTTSYEAERKSKLKRFALSRGYPYASFAPIQPHYLPFKLFRKGMNRRLFNHILLPGNRVEYTVFDYRFARLEGRYYHVYNQTVFSAVDESLSFPHFLLKPRGFWGRMAESMGSKSIKVSGYPRFAERYRLFGAETEKVLELFDSRVLSYLQSHPEEFFIEGYDRYLILYKMRKRLPPEDIDGRFPLFREIFTLFKKSAR